MNPLSKTSAISRLQGANCVSHQALQMGLDARLVPENTGIVLIDGTPNLKSILKHSLEADLL